jgi:hypothetical protein
MDNKGKWKSFTSDKINILAHVDAHTGTHIELASHLRLSVPILHTIVKNHEESEKRLCPVRTFLKAAQITEIFATGKTRICTCCMVQASM